MKNMPKMGKCRYCGTQLVRKMWQGGKRKRYESYKRMKARQYCGNVCRSLQLSIDSRGENNYFYGKHLKPWNYKKEIHWRTKQTNGYVRIIMRNEDGKNYYRYEHCMVAEDKMGRELRHKEVVHHIDGDKSNNNPDNLMVFPSNGEHIKFHKNRISANNTKS